MGQRIGELCWRKRIVLRDGISEWRRGRLLTWGTDFEELRDGVGQYPVGVIEDIESAAVDSVPVHLISFAEVAPTVE